MSSSSWQIRGAWMMATRASVPTSLGFHDRELDPTGDGENIHVPGGFGEALVSTAEAIASRNGTATPSAGRLSRVSGSDRMSMVKHGVNGSEGRIKRLIERGGSYQIHSTTDCVGSTWLQLFSSSGLRYRPSSVRDFRRSPGHRSGLCRMSYRLRRRCSAQFRVGAWYSA